MVSLLGAMAKLGELPADQLAALHIEAPADPEAFLRQLYGEWRKLPPVEARRNHAPVELDFGPYA